MMDSSGTKVPCPMLTKRGSTSLGTFTRANSSTAVTGSRNQTPMLSDRLEMYGKGLPGPTARGVSAGKICSLKIRSTSSSSSGELCEHCFTAIPCSASAGRITSSQWWDWRLPSSRVRSAIRSIVSSGDRPSGPRASIPAST